MKFIFPSKNPNQYILPVKKLQGQERKPISHEYETEQLIASVTDGMILLV